MYSSSNILAYTHQLLGCALAGGELAPYTVRSWERNASAPSNEILVQICKMYGVSADYLLGLADYDPDYTRRLHQAKFTESERRELKKYEQYLLWKRKH